VVRCDEVIKNAQGRVVELRAHADLETLGAAPVGRKVRGTIHWLNSQSAQRATVRLIEHLFNVDLPGSDDSADYRSELNPDSLKVLDGAYVEDFAAQAEPGGRFQFERCGYFYRDPNDDDLVFNRIVGLRDSWTKQTERPAVKPKVKPAPQLDQGPLVPEELRDQVAALVAKGLTEADAVRLCREPQVMAQWEASVAAGAAAGDAAKLLLNDLRALRKSSDDSVRLQGSQVAALVSLLGAGRVARADRKALLSHLLETGGEPEAVAAEMGILDRKNEFDLDALVAQVLADNAAEAARFRQGEQRLMGFLVGACMRAAKGRADARALQDVLRKALS
jgi:glutaminyl-tRNA synthetase